MVSPGLDFPQGQGLFVLGFCVCFFSVGSQETFEAFRAPPLVKKNLQEMKGIHECPVTAVAIMQGGFLKLYIFTQSHFLSPTNTED